MKNILNMLNLKNWQLKSGRKIVSQFPWTEGSVICKRPLTFLQSFHFKIHFKGWISLLSIIHLFPPKITTHIWAVMGGTRGLSFKKVIIFVPLHFNLTFYDLVLFLVISYCFVHGFKSSFHHPVQSSHLLFPFFSSLFLSLTFSPFNHWGVCVFLLSFQFSQAKNLCLKDSCSSATLNPWIPGNNFTGWMESSHQLSFHTWNKQSCCQGA